MVGLTMQLHKSWFGLAIPWIATRLCPINSAHGERSPIGGRLPSSALCAAEDAAAPDTYHNDSGSIAISKRRLRPVRIEVAAKHEAVNQARMALGRPRRSRDSVVASPIDRLSVERIADRESAELANLRQRGQSMLNRRVL